MYSKKNVNNFNRRWARIAIKDSDEYFSKPRAHVPDIADFSYWWIFYIIRSVQKVSIYSGQPLRYKLSEVKDER